MGIRYYGDSVLQTETEPVNITGDPFLRRVDEMCNLMYQLGGIGLAANQVGLLDRFFVYDLDDGTGPIVVINPELEVLDGEFAWNEGCLSVPGYFKQIVRPDRVILTARFLDRFKNKFYEDSIKAEGLKARLFQHEVDHLNGKVFIDLLNRQERRKALRVMQKHM